MSRTATDSTVLLGHGSGGQMMKRIIDEVFLDAFGSPELLAGNDAGVAALPASGRIAMSTDSFVVTPQFFPGGNIGRLAVCGTVNDVATSGANVRYLSCGFILEEGYPMDKLRQIVQTMAETAHEAGVKIITGDTKVVERGGADGVYINTAGVGEVPAGVALSGANCRPGDAILVSGTLGDHGIAIMSQREGLAFSSNIESDAAPLNHLIADVLAAAPDTRCFRDPTRGGLASTLNEFAQASGVAMEIDEDAVPVRPDVQAACEMLGYDVLQVANEGKMVAVVPAEQADAALAAMRAARYGENAAIIGRVLPLAEGARPAVRVRTGWGSTRILDMLVGEQLGIDPKEYAKSYLEGFDYKIGDVTVDEDKGTATAEVTFTCKSMNKIVEDFATQYQEKVAALDTTPSEDDLYKMAGQVMVDVTKAAKTKDTKVTFKYSANEDNEWSADDSATTEMMNAMMS